MLSLMAATIGGRDVGAQDRYKGWMEESRSDLETAGILMEAGRYNAAVFYCQQSAEKAMKGLLLKYHEAPWGHSVWNLYLAVAKATGEHDADVEAATKGLDLHYVPTRYPDALPSSTTPSQFYGKEQAGEAISWANMVMEYAARFV